MARRSRVAEVLGRGALVVNTDAFDGAVARGGATAMRGGDPDDARSASRSGSSCTEQESALESAPV
ncbi:MAG: hypothetical protein RBT75_07665 [Anaerolineae bacterium]|nr:hypothetical protein [Anaerolineae bacterium]